MRCNYLIGALVVAVCAASASRASAQNITGFTDGYNDVGPVVGFGNLGLGSVSYGGRFEHGFKELPNLGNGILAIGVSADYYHFSTGFSVFSASSYDYSVIPIAVTVNYHFHLDNKQIDPFVGAGIGYEHFGFPSCVFAGVDYCANAYGNRTYGIVRGGIRYFWQPKIALYADVASEGAAINVGVMFKVGGK